MVGRRLQCMALIAIYSSGAISLLLLLYLHLQFELSSPSKNLKESMTSHYLPPSARHRSCRLTLATAICGETPTTASVDGHKSWSVMEGGNIGVQLAQALVTIKSIVLMSTFYKVKGHVTSESDCIELIIFSDSEHTFNQLQSLLYQDGLWRRVYRNRIYFTYLPATYPQGFEDFQELYRPCATIKLFLPDMLPDLDSILYLDTDVILLVNPKKIWREFGGFSAQNWAGFAPDQYMYSSHHTLFYGKAGLNSGVALLNLTRMRESQFFSQIRSTATKFWRGIRSDQDIFNIYFHYHPEEMKELSCSQNFMYFSCEEEWQCDTSEIEILHGAAHTFLPEREEPFLRGIFQCFNQTTLFQTNSSRDLHEQLTDCIDNEKFIRNSSCSQYLSTRNIIHIKND